MTQTVSGVVPDLIYPLALGGSQFADFGSAVMWRVACGSLTA